MKNYEKPIIITNEEIAEGVYAASGDCYTFKARIVQTPATGLPYYVIQIDGKHNALDGHHSNNRTVKITFNQPVTYVESMAKSCSGSGTNMLSLEYEGTNGSYHNNAVENIGLGDLKVTSAEGLAITDTFCTFCAQACDNPGHTW